jgi:ketosteroid isomerase-like protein
MKTYLTALALCANAFVFAQYHYEPSIEHPFGLPNLEAPQQILDFAPLIGECNCKSVMRKPDRTWAEPVDMIWKFKYIMNGMAVQDETLKADGKHGGSIRQFIADSTKWYVHYYSSGSPSTTLPAWEGNKNEDGNIVLYREQKAPNGMDGYYKITFSDMSASGFKWAGEWVNIDETIIYPTWKIDCTKNVGSIASAEKEKILATAKNFSKAYMDGDLDAMVNAYTEDGKIFPDNTSIIEGSEALGKYWQLPEGVTVLHHALQPKEINVIGKVAYDYGYYEGKTKNGDGNSNEWKGKYVVIWKKVGNDWKMYLDIWNSVQD